VNASKAEPTEESAPAQDTRPKSYWALPPPDPPSSNRRIGWLLVGLGVSAMATLAVYLATGMAGSDPNDGGLADIAFVVSPILAAIVAVVTGLLLAIVAKLRLVGFSVARAIRGTIIGLIGGPVIYLVVLILVTYSGSLTQSMPVLGFVMFLAPVICGSSVTLISVRARAS
jgi:hypothetical protein